jgi:UrcA family protein
MSKPLAFLLCFTVPIAAVAANNPTMSVEYDDLDLTTETGMKKLDQRINMAARKVCGSAETLTGTRLRDKSSIDCVKEAAAKARAQIAATKPVSKS